MTVPGPPNFYRDKNEPQTSPIHNQWHMDESATSAGWLLIPPLPVRDWILHDDGSDWQRNIGTEYKGNG